MPTDSLLLSRDELTDLTSIVAGIIYDVYYTQCYVSINKQRGEEKQLTNITQDDLNEVFKKTEDLLKHFSFKSESDEIMDLYHKILDEDKGLLMTEQNINNMVKLALANCDAPLDVGPCIVHFNSFFEEDSDEMKNTLDNLVEMFDKVYMEHDLTEFMFLCAEGLPLLTKYVINELEICDILKPLGDVNGVKVFYLGVESKPTPPLGYSSEFSYPLIPYRMSGFIDFNGMVVNDSHKSDICFICVIKDMNIYEFENTRECVDIQILLTKLEDGAVILKRGIRLSFEDYLKVYMTEDIPKFINVMMGLVS